MRRAITFRLHLQISRSTYSTKRTGGLPNVEMAKKTHMSPAACRSEIAQNFKIWCIEKIKAMLNPAEPSGLEATVIVGVIFNRSTKDSFAEFEAAIKKIAMIEECYLVAGDVDYFFKLESENY